jgi:hypothetical protein
MPQSLDEERRRAIALVESEVARLRSEQPAALRSLALDSPIESERDGIVVTTHVTPEGERVMVLVEAWRGRRTLATGGFAMHPDGSAHTPH